jgi:hypothetical protein
MNVANTHQIVARCMLEASMIDMVVSMCVHACIAGCRMKISVVICVVACMMCARLLSCHVAVDVIRTRK